MILAVAALDLLVICLCPHTLIWGSTIPRISIVARPSGNGGYGCWYPLFSFKIPFPRRHVSAPLSFAPLVPELGRACSLAATFISPNRGASPLAIMFGSEMMLGFKAWRRLRSNRMFASPDVVTFLPEVTIFDGKISSSRLRQFSFVREAGLQSVAWL